MQNWLTLWISEDKTTRSHSAKHCREVVSKSRFLKSELFIYHRLRFSMVTNAATMFDSSLKLSSA